MMKRRFGTAAVAGTVVAAMGLLGSGVAHAASLADFETDAVGSSTPTGWTVIGGRVDLGVTEIAGCASIDTSDYSNLREWEIQRDPMGGDNNVDHPNLTGFEEWVAWGESTQASYNGQLVWYDGLNYVYALGPASATDISEMTLVSSLSDTEREAFLDAFIVPPAERNDSDYVLEDGESEEYLVEVVDGSLLEPFEGEERDYPLARSGNVLEMSSDMDGDPAGYVVHGPAVYSDPFTSGPGRQLSLWWAASGASDDYHVLGYLLNVDTCEQIEVLDSTGEAIEWAEAVAQVPSTGTYRFVFVAGTYDMSWGGAAGGLLWIDDVAEEPGTVLPSTGSGDGTWLLAIGLVAAGALTLTGRRIFG